MNVAAPRELLGLALTALVVVAPALGRVAFAEPVKGIAPATGRPVIVRGGVLVLPLSASVPGDGWPSTIGLRFEDGETLSAPVAWVHRSPSPVVRRWSDEPSGLAVRPIAPTDSTAESRDGGAPYAILQLSSGRGGDFLVVDPRDRTTAPVSVRPMWFDDMPPGAPATAPPLERREDPARPDPDSPFEHWRWVLLADRREMLPPPFPAASPEDARGQLAGLVARHGAEMWRIGLARLETQSPGVAAACREALTQTAFDGDREIAAWVMDSVETGALLTILLDFNRRDRAVMEASLGWVESRNPLLIWSEQEQGGVVTLAIVNPLVESLELTIDWLGTTAATATRSLRGAEVSRVHVARPGELATPTATPTIRKVDPREIPLSMVIQCRGHRRDFAVNPAIALARPPGLALPVFRPPLRLAEASSGRQRPVDVRRATAGILRRLNGRWELFIECAREGEASEDGVPVPERLPIGQEAITLIIGARESPQAVLCVPERGEPWLPTGERPGDLEVHRRILPTVWRCRIVLPESWRPPNPGEPFLLGIARTHGTDDALETSGVPQVPWDPLPAPIAVDLSAWDRISNR